MPADDPYRPDKISLLDNSDIEFRKAYIVNNDASDPLVCLAIQDYLNDTLSPDEFDPDAILDDVGQLSGYNLLRAKALLEEELLHKLSWQLAWILSSPAKWDTAMKQVVKAARFIHGDNGLKGERLQTQEAPLGSSSINQGENLDARDPVDLLDRALCCSAIIVVSEDASANTRDTQLEAQSINVDTSTDHNTPKGSVREACKDDSTEQTKKLSKKEKKKANKDAKKQDKNSKSGTKPLVKNSLRSRVKLFMFQKGRVPSLSKDEAKLVFGAPKYLFAWRNINRAKSLLDGNPSPIQVERKIKEMYRKEVVAAKEDWSVFWNSLINDRSEVKELIHRKQAEEGEQPSPGQTNLTSKAHDESTHEQSELSMEVENPGASASNLERTDRSTSPTAGVSNIGLKENEVSCSVSDTIEVSKLKKRLSWDCC